MSIQNKLGRVPSLLFADVIAERESGFSPFAWMIWHITRGPWNHIALGLGATHLIEAQPGGVGVNESARLAKSWWVQLRYQPALNGTQSIAMDQFLSKQMGKGYDWSGVFGFSIFSPASHAGDPSRWFCSELAAAAFKAAGAPLLERTPPGLIPPSELVESPKLVIVDYQWPKELMEWIE